MLDLALQKANQDNINFFIVPYVSDKDFVPEWLIQKYNLPTFRFPFHPTYQTQFGNLSQGYFVPIWRDEYLQTLQIFLVELLKHPIFQSEKFKFMYFPGAWRWGEFTVEFIQQMESEGLDPAAYLNKTKALIDIYVDAFQGKVDKLVWTGYDNLEYCDHNDF